jgi:hypothetical protein
MCADSTSACVREGGCGHGNISDMNQGWGRGGVHSVPSGTIREQEDLDHQRQGRKGRGGRHLHVITKKS